MRSTVIIFPKELENDAKTFFHATPEENFSRILKEGTKPKSLLDNPRALTSISLGHTSKDTLSTLNCRRSNNKKCRRNSKWSL